MYEDSCSSEAWYFIGDANHGRKWEEGMTCTVDTAWWIDPLIAHSSDGNRNAYNGPGLRVVKLV